MSLVSQLISHNLSYAGQLARAHSIGAMNSLVIITRDGSYDNTLREYDPTTQVVLYDEWDTNNAATGNGAIAGVTQDPGPNTMSLGDEQQYYASIIVYIPRSGAKQSVRIDDVVKVISSPDVDITGRYFRVTGSPAGGRIYSSNSLQCTGIAPSKQWQI